MWPIQLNRPRCIVKFYCIKKNHQHFPAHSVLPTHQCPLWNNSDLRGATGSWAVLPCHILWHNYHRIAHSGPFNLRHCCSHLIFLYLSTPIFYVENKNQWSSMDFFWGVLFSPSTLHLYIGRYFKNPVFLFRENLCVNMFFLTTLW